MNLNSKADFDSLTQAVDDSFRKLEPFRKKRTELIKAFAGSEYTEDINALKTYLHLLAMAVDIYVRQLAVRAPTANVTSPFSELRPLAYSLSLACDDAAKDVALGVTLRRAVTDALFSPKSVIKVGLVAAPPEERDGVSVDSTDPFVKKISFDDYVCDMSARSAYAPAFEGDRYYLPMEDFRTRYGAKASRLGVSGEELSMQDEHGTDRAEVISHEPASGDDNFRDRVALWDIWIPENRQLVTYLANNPSAGKLNLIDFDAPEEKGVYHSLWFTSVPDNAMPMPPFARLKNLHEFANSLFRRMNAQAEKHKRLVGFSDAESAKRFSQAHDGTGVHWEGQPPANIQAGGLDPSLMGLFIQVKDIFSWSAGNLDSLGGLSPMTETVGQDEMLQRSAGAQLADMQEATTDFARGIFEQVAWYEWTDPIRERVLQKDAGAGVFIPVKWSPETREGDFLSFNFDIHPHSMREDNPATKLQKIQAMLNQIFAPLTPFMQQQGLTVDVRRLNEIVSDYANLPEFVELIISVDPSQALGGEGPAGNPEPSLAKPATTNRTYTRVNRPGATRVGKDMALTQSLLGKAPQGAEMASVPRAVS